MGWGPCRKCGELRKEDTYISAAGWHQPACTHCGDPAFIEPLLQVDLYCARCGHADLEHFEATGECLHDLCSCRALSIRRPPGGK